MEFGPDKPRTMARSILPSRARWAARTRALIHRASRRNVRLGLARIAADPESWDDACDPFDDTQRDIGPFVSNRRSADKLNPFQRWATRVTTELNPEHRLGRMRALLPAGVIGEHAISHLKNLDAFRTAHDRLMRQKYEHRRAKNPMHTGELAQLLRQILEAPDGQRLLNLALKRTAHWRQLAGDIVFVGTRPVRTLLGTHDVLPFLTELTKSRSNRLDLVRAFCIIFKSTRDPLHAWFALHPGEEPGAAPSPSTRTR